MGHRQPALAPQPGERPIDFRKLSLQMMPGSLEGGSVRLDDQLALGQDQKRALHRDQRDRLPALLAGGLQRNHVGRRSLHEAVLKMLVHQAHVRTELLRCDEGTVDRLFTGQTRAV